MQRIVSRIGLFLFLCSTASAHDYIVKIDKQKFNFKSSFTQDMSPLVPELGIYLVKTKNFVSGSEKKEVRRLRQAPGVIYAQLDTPVTMRAKTPNDPMLKDQWHHKNSKNGSHMRG